MSILLSILPFVRKFLPVWKLAVVGVALAALTAAFFWIRQDARNDLRDELMRESIKEEEDAREDIKKAVPRRSDDANRSREWLREFIQ